MVRATFAGFSTALSALQANQKRLDIIGHNLSNMNTTGYTRQTLETSSINYRTPVSNYMNGAEVIVGFGVSMDKVSQIRDPYLDVQYRNQMQKAGYTDAIQTSLDRLAKFFDESNITGIRSAFDDIQASLINMQDAPKVNDAIYETELRTKMQALTNLLNQADNEITKSEQLEFISLDGTNTSENGAVQAVNDMLMQIGNLNRQIKQNQILGQQSLELMDERNVLLDKLSSYIPIEVTYYKDQMHDGLAADGTTPAPGEEFHLDSAGNPIARKEWPDDLRVEMLYTNEKGETQRLTLVEGTEGTGSQNYGRLDLDITNPDEVPYPDNFTLKFTAAEKRITNSATSDVTFSQDTMTADATARGGNQLPGGSIQASLDMLWKSGNTNNKTNNNNDIRGYEYYRNELNTLARTFADVMNAINVYGTNDDPDVKGKDKDWILLVNKTDSTNPTTNITAGNIGINSAWVSGDVHISKAGDNATDTVLNMLEAMGATYPYTGSKLADILKDMIPEMGAATPDLKHNSFADFMNNAATTLANDSYANSYALKNDVTVLNSIQNSRDSMSGVSLDEEASNMMMYQAAYNAASRLMTALDEVLNTLINSTGVCGR